MAASEARTDLVRIVGKGVFRVLSMPSDVSECCVWLFRGFIFSHIATWKQEIPNIWNSSGETGNRTPDPLLRKPRVWQVDNCRSPGQWMTPSHSTMGTDRWPKMQVVLVRRNDVSYFRMPYGTDPVTMSYMNWQIYWKWSDGGNVLLNWFKGG